MKIFRLFLVCVLVVAICFTQTIPPPGGGGGSGTVTSVGFTGGLISVATATTTPALTVAGTSGGVPYFSSTSTWASSGLLAQYGVMIGGGAAATPATISASTTTTHALFATATAPAFRALALGDLPATVKARPLSFTFSGNGSALTTGLVAYDVDATSPCTISGYAIGADQGTVTVKFWKVAGGTALPTVANVISTSGVSLSSGTRVRSTTVSDFTDTAVAAQDQVAATITAVAGGATWVQAKLECSQ